MFVSRSEVSWAWPRSNLDNFGPRAREREVASSDDGKGSAGWASTARTESRERPGRNGPGASGFQTHGTACRSARSAHPCAAPVAAFPGTGPPPKSTAATRPGGPAGARPASSVTLHQLFSASAKVSARKTGGPAAGAHGKRRRVRLAWAGVAAVDVRRLRAPATARRCCTRPVAGEQSERGVGYRKLAASVHGPRSSPCGPAGSLIQTEEIAGGVQKSCGDFRGASAPIGWHEPSPGRERPTKPAESVRRDLTCRP